MFSKENLAGGGNKIKEESLFSPPVKELVGDISDRSVYARYSPAYYNNSDIMVQDTLTIFCKGLQATKPTVDTLLENLYIATGSYPGGVGGIKYSDYVNLFNGVSGAAINTLLDSLFLKQKVSVKQNTINPTTGEAVSTTDTKDIYRWSIQTKFEAPLIDYSDSTNYLSQSLLGINYLVRSGGAVASFAAPLNYQEESINGIWNSRGAIPKDGESVQIELYDDLYGDYSLFNLCGFKKETKTIGRLANQREISEAVIVLPYCKTDVTRQMSKANIDEANKWFMPIALDKINKALGVPDYTKININKIKNILDTSPNIDAGSELVKLLKAVVKYNIPPHLNWLKDKTIKPFVIYIAEFSHTLDKQDLADIWQGNMPKIAQTPEEQQVVVEHALDSDNFYDRTALDRYLAAGMYIKVFKVKQRGKMAYSEITAGAEDDAKFNTDFPDKWYSYNWPYDYFSLVELLNIKAGEVYENTGSV